MINTPTAPQPGTVSTVPLRRDYLLQASLFEERTYPLPKVMPGQEAVIYDADEWQHNFMRGIVTGYRYSNGLHTIHFESVSEGQFYDREIKKAR